MKNRIQRLIAGETYFNIHSTMLRGGEIRGQLMRVVLEPASLPLLGIAWLASRPAVVSRLLNEPAHGRVFYIGLDGLRLTLCVSPGIDR